jgi:hypothetical protein
MRLQVNLSFPPQPFPFPKKSNSAPQAATTGLRARGLLLRPTGTQRPCSGGQKNLTEPMGTNPSVNNGLLQGIFIFHFRILN